MKVVETILASTIVLIWLILFGYLCVGGLTLVQTIEKVQLIEQKVEEEIVWEISFADNRKIRPESFIWRLEQKINDKKIDAKLTFDDKEAIKDLWHAYWYYGYEGFSYVTFLVLLPYSVLLFLTAAAAGGVGVVGKIIVEIAIEKSKIIDTNYISMPLLGCFMGIMVISISFIIPAILTKGDTILNMKSVVLLCFFAGVFNSRFYNWIIEKIEGILKKK